MGKEQGRLRTGRRRSFAERGVAQFTAIWRMSSRSSQRDSRLQGDACAECGEREKLNEIQCTALWRGEAAFVLTRVVHFLGCLLVEIGMPRQRTCDRNEKQVSK